MSKHSFRVLAISIALGFWYATASAQLKPAPAKPELPIPANALFAVQIRGIGTAREKLEKFVTSVAPDRAKGLLEGLTNFLTEAMTGRDAAAIDAAGTVFAVVHDFDLKAMTATYSLMLPCKDYKLFRTKFLTVAERKSLTSAGDLVDELEFQNRPAFAIDLTKSGYVAIAFDKPTAEFLSEKYPRLKVADLGEAGASVFLGTDLAVFVNLREVHERYGKALNSYRLLLAGLLRNGGLGVIPKLDKRQLAVARLAVDGLFQALEDGQAIALGVAFDDAGVTLRADVSFRPETDTAKLLAEEKPRKLEQLLELPANQTTFTAGAWSPRVGSFANRLAPEYTPQPDDDRAWAAAEKFADLSAKTVWCSASSGVGSGLQATTPPDPAALASAHLKLLKNLAAGSAYKNLPLKESPTIKEGEQQHAGFTLSRVVLKVDFEAATANIADETVREAAIQSMKRIVQETTTIWFGHDGRRYVEITSVDWDAARGFLDTYREKKIPLGQDPDLLELRKRLPAEATQIAVVEVRKGLVGLSSYSRAVIGAMPAFPGLEIPEIKTVPPGRDTFAGAALVLRPGGIGAVVVVPMSSAKVAANALMPPTPKAP